MLNTNTNINALYFKVLMLHTNGHPNDLCQITKHDVQHGLFWQDSVITLLIRTGHMVAIPIPFVGLL